MVETTNRRRKLNPLYNDSIITETVGQRDNQHGLNPDEFKTDMMRLYMAVIDSVIGEMRRRFVGDDNRTYIESLKATDPASETLSYDKLLPLAKLGNVLLSQAELAVAKLHIASHMPDASTLSAMQDPVISKDTPSVRDVLSVALTFGASSSTCEGTFSTLSRILTAYRRLMLHRRKANLVVLAFEHDLTSGLLHKKELILRRFNNMSNRRLQLF